ncbi:esterase/lipase family protein [Kutzneria kofuensis]|uniref:Triacylglycerol esterase/lipase EstA (Alpha/beta hydrolase family) n=1 Tax=Kutzneria kofuensis TaxID=103725 RepID=A0A7W9KHM0_9PSEU|nr:alpha/beta fold hydrolase [Kutzneria kofuensis]MBB5892736.1 triacylglycerol esterase/lipase EstA (alpha/beta hydrolase family) [Kutzneria kofuensis]
MTGLALVTASMIVTTSVASASESAAGPAQPNIVSAAVYALSHPTASPPGANDFSCKPTAAHPRPVVLSNGTGANAYDDWAGLSGVLKRDGYCVFAPNLGGPEGGLFQAVGDIPTTAGQFGQYVDKVLAATGAAKVDIVGHSQGGMLPRYYLKYLGGASKVGTLVGLAPSNHGTNLDGLVDAVRSLPGGGDFADGVIGAVCPACVQQEVGSTLLAGLNDGGDTVPGVNYTVVATRTDEVVTPYTSAYLSGPTVTNHRLQDYCMIDGTEHINITYDHIAIQLVRNALDPAHAWTPNCLT